MKASASTNMGDGGMNSRILVAVIDDDDSARSSLARLIRSVDIDARTFSSAREFLSRAAGEDWDCAVSDVRMPEIDGLELQGYLGSSYPDLPLIFITGFADIPTTVRAMRGGAIDVLEKPVKASALAAALRRAAKQGRILKAQRAVRDKVRQRFELLTVRERQVFELVTSGLLNKQIGFKLGTTEKTIKVHRARVVEKMQANSLADLVRMADTLRTADAG
jgi:FixJ family two-component response regulator